jgi:hypothetical protein
MILMSVREMLRMGMEMRMRMGMMLEMLGRVMQMEMMDNIEVGKRWKRREKMIVVHIWMIVIS